MDKKEWIIKAVKSAIVDAITTSDNAKDFVLINIQNQDFRYLMIWGTLQIYFRFSNYVSFEEMIAILKDWDFLVGWSIYRDDDLSIVFNKRGN